MSQTCNRRQFLARSGKAAALSLPSMFSCPGLLSGQERNTVRLGLIGLGGRGGYLAKRLPEVKGMTLAGICDPDSERLNNIKKQYPDASSHTDFRAILDDRSIDAVIIATPNYWHCLAAVWAMRAGKDVYVEKPLCMSFREGQQVVAASKKYDKICQIGTQSRTDPVFHSEVRKFLHEDRELGEIRSVRINRFAPRNSIGKRETPLPIPSTVDYNLWLGPVEERPLYRNQFHYDWHWMWQTGHGEMGNWGAHLIDDCRNAILQDKVRMPKRVLCGGGRVGYNDAGETPNSCFTFFDTGSIPVVFCISNLPDAKNPKSTGTCPGPTSGYVAYCEGGTYAKQWGSSVAVDYQGKTIREFKGTNELDGAVFHIQNFINAVAAHDRSGLNAPIEIGYDSASWYNGANIAYRLGRPYSKTDALAITGTDGRLAEAIENLETHLTAQGIPMNADNFVLSDFLEIDAEKGCFTGNRADEANALMDIQYREPFVFPEIA